MTLIPPQGDDRAKSKGQVRNVERLSRTEFVNKCTKGEFSSFPVGVFRDGHSSFLVSVLESGRSSVYKFTPKQRTKSYSIELITRMVC